MSMTRGLVHKIYAQGWGVSLSPACTLSNLGPLKGCSTANLSPNPPGSGLNGQLDIPLTIQDYWLPTARLPTSLINI